MSFRGRGGRGGRGRGGRGGFRGGRGGFNRYDEGPPDYVENLGVFLHSSEEFAIYKSVLPDKVPYFNAAVYLENKTKVGKVDEIFGQTEDVMFSVKVDEGYPAKAYEKNDKIYINPQKLLPKERFTDPEAYKKNRGSFGGGSRGGRGRGRGRGRGGFSRGGRGRGGRGSGFGSRGRGGFRGRKSF
eukprot:maker-scaffold_21-snap-gene-1.2-mRNA-1 protein AED:0.02 eAED:0.02 QI:125/1/1/1/1/1/2/41/184